MIYERYIPCLWIGKFNNIKIAIVPKFIYKLNVIPVKIPTEFLWNFISCFCNVPGKKGDTYR